MLSEVFNKVLIKPITYGIFVPVLACLFQPNPPIIVPMNVPMKRSWRASWAQILCPSRKYSCRETKKWWAQNHGISHKLL